MVQLKSYRKGISGSNLRDMIAAAREPTTSVTRAARKVKTSKNPTATAEEPTSTAFASIKLTNNKLK